MGDNVYKPKTTTAKLTRKKKNGQFVNPPTYGEVGGMTGPSKLMRGEKTNLRLESGGPKGRRGPL